MNTTRPFFSVIIPTYARPVQLLTCIKALTNLDKPKKNFEVIIVDDGSPQSIKSILKTFKNELNITHLKQTNKGPASARNKGARQANGHYLIFIDDDCQIQPNYLIQLEQLIQTRSEEIFVGQTLNGLSNNVFASASQLLTDFLYSFFTDKSQQTTFLVSNNFAIQKSLFLNAKGFDSNFKRAASEDRELGAKLLHLGYKIFYAKNLKVYHTHQMNFKQFWKQHFTYGQGAFYFRQISQQNNYQLKKIAPLPFYSKMLLFPFKKAFNWSKFNHFLLILISQIAYIAGYLNEKWNS